MRKCATLHEVSFQPEQLKYRIKQFLPNAAYTQQELSVYLWAGQKWVTEVLTAYSSSS